MKARGGKLARMDTSVRVLTLRRAAEILGGPVQLRIYLNVSAICLAAWK